MRPISAAPTAMRIEPLLEAPTKQNQTPVMPLGRASTNRRKHKFKNWMAGTSPAMTTNRLSPS